MFEITTRPPNTYVFNNHPQQTAAQTQQQQQQQTSLSSSQTQLHLNNQPPQTPLNRRNQTIHFRSPRSSSLSTQITNFNSAKHFPQFFLHNDVNNLTQIGGQTDHGGSQDFIFTTMPITTTMKSTTANSATPIQVNPSSYVTRIITGNNSNDAKGKKLASSSASYFHPNADHSYSSVDISPYKRTPSSGTILPVYYQNETTGQTCPINNSLPTIKNVSVNTASKPPITIKQPTNQLPNLNNGSPTAVVTITNGNGGNSSSSINGVKTYQQIRPQVSSIHNSYSNLADNSNEYNKIIKTVNIPNYFNNSSNSSNSNNSFTSDYKNNSYTDPEYPLKLTSKHYSVIKGIKARQEMLSPASSNSTITYNHYNNSNSNLNSSSNGTIKSNLNEEMAEKLFAEKADFKPKPACNYSTSTNNETSNVINNKKYNSIPVLTDHITRYDSENSFDLSSNSFMNNSISANSNASANTVTKSILVNRKRFANPVNINKKTVSFAT